MPKKPLILIVDDTLKNIQVLGSILLEHEYDIHVAQNGQQALDAANVINPDLILLDVIMPELDGFETCRCLKAKTKTQHIPVIFLTAKTTEEDMLKGFELGGVDYVTKPFSSVVLLARVNTHLNLKFANEELTQQKVALEKSILLRENVERIIRHDLKSPLSGIISVSSLLDEMPNLELYRRQKFIKNIKNSGYRMLEMINNSLDIYKIETGTYVCNPELVDILSVIKKVITENEYITRINNLSIDVLSQGKSVSKQELFTIQGEQLLCYSIFANLLKNAVEASPDEERITISVDKDDSHCVLSIHNKGAIPESIRAKFFDKYITANKYDGTGLGTYSAKLMAETQGGTINFETSEEIGTTVIVSLPNFVGNPEPDEHAGSQP